MVLVTFLSSVTRSLLLYARVKTVYNDDWTQVLEQTMGEVVFFDARSESVNRTGLSRPAGQFYEWNSNRVLLKGHQRSVYNAFIV